MYLHCVTSKFDKKMKKVSSKLVRRVFIICAAIIMGIFMISFVCEVGNRWYSTYTRLHNCYDPDCYESTRISRDIYFHKHYRGDGYVYNARTGDKVLKHVEWIAGPADRDTLVCFSNGNKRGYFSKNTGKVVIEPQYDHAWIFSDGLACVEENGRIKFIDGTGKVVIDKDMTYLPWVEDYVFHGGYCVVYADDEEHCGLMDKTGNVVLPMEYDDIYLAYDHKHWCVKKGKEMALLDKDLKTVMPLAEWHVNAGEEEITARMPDHTVRKYDMQGTLINDFYISDVRMLEYEKDEILYRCETHDEDGNEYVVPIMESYHPLATARLRAYGVENGYEGLITADGHIVTMPLYRDIKAIGHDLYLCTINGYDKVIVNGKGDIVK